jgi:hypothetical protein
MLDSGLIDRLEGIEEELEMIKRALKDRRVKLGGRFKETRFEEEDFEDAKASVFNIS